MIFVMILLFEYFIDSLTNLKGKFGITNILAKTAHDTWTIVWQCD